MSKSKAVVKGPDRKNETLDWFLYREHIFSSRDEASQYVTQKGIRINNKMITSIKYIPKIGDEMVVYKDCKMTFKVAE